MLDQMIFCLFVCGFFSCLFVCVITARYPLSCRILCDSQSFLPCLLSALLGLTLRAPQTFLVCIYTSPKLYPLMLQNNWLLSLSYSLSLNKKKENIQTLIRLYIIQSWNRWIIFLSEFLDTMCEPSGNVCSVGMVRDVKSLHATSLGPSWHPASCSRVRGSLEDLCRWDRTKGQKQLISF